MKLQNLICISTLLDAREQHTFLHVKVRMAQRITEFQSLAEYEVFRLRLSGFNLRRPGGILRVCSQPTVAGALEAQGPSPSAPSASGLRLCQNVTHSATSPRVTRRQGGSSVNARTQDRDRSQDHCRLVGVVLVPIIPALGITPVSLRNPARLLQLRSPNSPAPSGLQAAHLHLLLAWRTTTRDSAPVLGGPPGAVCCAPALRGRSRGFLTPRWQAGRPAQGRRPRTARELWVCDS
ncbi:uncharacterized protein LOC122238788 [Panthera tigris]|uniref:uncharacterized protein LOC122238788 n=1 Tax=Panthera tigris TaxID=9694 RepID=UPI001C6F66EC|nr:uncharacterized protein LOC122238788 [Panthera tigris]